VIRSSVDKTGGRAADRERLSCLPEEEPLLSILAALACRLPTHGRDSESAVSESDDDCDGGADAWYPDADGDGYGSGVEQMDCKAPEGFVAVSGDCDDGSADAHPGALETCNGIDDDCDGATDDGFDVDGDGHLSTACATGDDCDDEDAAVYSGAPELCGDGRDNDCVGGDTNCALSGDYPLADADAKIVATEPFEEMARLLQVGDVNGDGTLDVFAAAEWSSGGTGGGHVLYGPFAGTHEAPDLGVAALGSGDMRAAGRSIGLGDLNDDGYADIELGAPYSSEAFVQFGPVTADFALVDSNLHVRGTGNDFFGHGSDVADVSGDGIDDLIVGAYGYSGAGKGSSGSTFVWHGPLTAGELAIDSHDVELYGSEVLLQTGHIITAGADMDGDGVGDMLNHAFGYSAGAPGGCAVVVVHGPLVSDLDLADADAWLVGVTPYSYVGWGMGQGDLDGDGLADALVGAPYGFDSATSHLADGAAWVVSGPTTGVVPLSDADVVISGTNGAWVGLSMAVGDLDGNGETELVVGAPYDEGVGSALVFFGAMPGAWDDTDAGARFVGEDAAEQAGSAVATVDLDASGTLDLLVGAMGETTGAKLGGALYVMTSE
jgi:hypothetical protein